MRPTTTFSDQRPEQLQTLGDCVLIEVGHKLQQQHPHLRMPKPRQRAINDREREGRIIYVGPYCKHVKAGQWCWFVRGSVQGVGENFVVDGVTYLKLPEFNIGLVDGEPVGDRILVALPPKRRRTTLKGVVLPDSDKEPVGEGRVVALGPEVVVSVSVGDYAYFGPIDGQDVDIDGEAHRLLRQDELGAVLVESA